MVMEDPHMFDNDLVGVARDLKGGFFCGFLRRSVSSR